MVKEEESDDEQDKMIKDTDSLIVIGKIEGEFSSLEVYLYEEEFNNLYVHHDIMLSTFPLCMEWLPIMPGSIEGNTMR